MTHMLTGKSIFLTDIGGAFGEAIAAAVLTAGGRIAAGCSLPTPPALYADICIAHAPNDPASWTQVLEEAEARLGTLTGFVNNPELLVRGSIADLDGEGWQRARAGGLDAAMYGIRAALPRLRWIQGSSLVNLCSIAGDIGLANYVSTCATAFAIRPMTRSAAVHALEKGYETRVNCIVAGFDPGGPLAASLPELAVDPCDVAGMVVFLLSDAAKGANGAEFTIDGGGSLHPA